MKGSGKDNEVKKPLDRSRSYIPYQHMVDSTFLKEYSAAEQEARNALRASNLPPTRQPHLFAKDVWHGKKVCISCRCLGHTAGECRRTKEQLERQIAVCKLALDDIAASKAAGTGDQ